MSDVRDGLREKHNVISMMLTMVVILIILSLLYIYLTNICCNS